MNLWFGPLYWKVWGAEFHPMIKISFVDVVIVTAVSLRELNMHYALSYYTIPLECCLQLQGNSI